MKAVLDFIIDLLPRLAVMAVVIVFSTLLAQFKIRTVSVWSMSVNAIHLAMTVAVPSYFRRQPSGQYLRFVGVLMTAEFLMVLAVVVPLVYSLCSPRTSYQTGAYGLSIDAAPPPVEIPRRPTSDWIWAGVPLASFVLSFAVIIRVG